MTKNLPTNTPTKQDKFIAALFVTQTIQEAAKIAGYSQNSRTSFVYDLVKRPEFAAKMRGYAIANDLQTLPQIARIEQICLDQVEKNPENYPKYRDIFRQKKVVTGLMDSDEAPRQPTINIKTIENLQVVVGGDLARRLMDNGK